MTARGFFHRPAWLYACDWAEAFPTLAPWGMGAFFFLVEFGSGLRFSGEVFFFRGAAAGREWAL